MSENKQILKEQVDKAMAVICETFVMSIDGLEIVLGIDLQGFEASCGSWVITLRKNNEPS
jgi:uncharacterized protein (UPF0254 family)